MPLTEFQKCIAKFLSVNRSGDSYLAGGSAFNLVPNSTRYSNDLDYFHDSPERVARAFEDDSTLLRAQGYNVELEMSQPGYIRAIVEKGNQKTKVEWAHDSAWRFMPTLYSEEFGYQLHPVDLAINKILALVGRDEPRDFIDAMFAHNEMLSLGALIWAAAGKDPGFTPCSILELLKRKGKYREEDFTRLHLTKPVDLIQLKTFWISALRQAEEFIKSRPNSELGCLYYSPKERNFVTPEKDEHVQVHHGRPGGIIPNLYEGDMLAESFSGIKQ